MSLRDVSINLIRQLDIELTGENLSKVQDTLVRIDDEADQFGDHHGYERGLRAALEAVRAKLSGRTTGSLDYAAGLSAACDAIERLLEKDEKGKEG